MALQNSAATDGNSAQSVPSTVTDAVLKPSDPLPHGMTQVEGIDFDRYTDRSITAEELITGMKNMGFQATSVAEAVRITNNMVCYVRSHTSHGQSDHTNTRELGEIRRHQKAQPSF